MKKNVRIIGVPIDLGAGRRGVDMGPSAIRVAGLAGRIAELGHTVSDFGDVRVKLPEVSKTGSEKLRYAGAVHTINRHIAEVVHETLDAGALPVVIGGDHSIAIGSVAGVSAHWAQQSSSVGLIWVDAHADLNSPETTPSGNIHGMSLAVALGIGDPRFTELHRPGRKVDPHNVVLVGARDLDEGERRLLRELEVTVLSMRDIDERGMYSVMQRAIETASRNTAGISVQFDMDAVDPSEAPGTGTPVPGGLTYREAHLAMEMLGDSGSLVSVDVVETNPALDVRNQTAKLASELILSALGKRIFRGGDA